MSCRRCDRASRGSIVRRPTERSDVTAIQEQDALADRSPALVAVFLPDAAMPAFSEIHGITASRIEVVMLVEQHPIVGSVDHAESRCVRINQGHDLDDDVGCGCALCRASSSSGSIHCVGSEHQDPVASNRRRGVAASGEDSRRTSVPSQTHQYKCVDLPIFVRWRKRRHGFRPSENDPNTCGVW